MTLYNATNRKHIRVAEKELEDRDNTRLQFLRAAMDTAQGRLWFHDFLAACQTDVIDPIFEPNHDYFALGQRNVGLRVKADILTHCPDQYIQMMREEHVRQHTTAARQQSRSPDAGGGDSGPDLNPIGDDAGDAEE